MSPHPQTEYAFDSRAALLSTSLNLPKRSGKVRDVYDCGEHLLIVSTDRISAFDYVLPVGIPGKGSLLTQMSRFWFDSMDQDHHLISCQVDDIAWPDGTQPDDLAPLAGRVMLTRKAKVIPFECVVRGYLEGSGWKEYQIDGKIGGHPLPAGLKHCDRLPEPMFSPATKAESGHDENVSFETLVDQLGSELAGELKRRSLDLYHWASQHAAQKGLIIADTKFEFGFDDNALLLIDEVLTPDSSRFWDQRNYAPGASQPSFDKQFVRSWLLASDWDRNSPPPPLPDDVIDQTIAKYREAARRLTENA
ncbi:MAG: phosphoribosylaminoimidazolesuccinocarboxamide synthase [Planctomycetota bacterium]